MLRLLILLCALRCAPLTTAYRKESYKGHYGQVSVSLRPHKQRVKAGMMFRFHCATSTTSHVDSRTGERVLYVTSTPQVTWLKDGLNLTALVANHAGSGSRYLINRGNNELIVYNAYTNDTGNYTCEARSRDEMDSKTAKLVVEDVPDPPIKVRLTSCENRVAQIQWQLSNENHSPVTEYIIQYNTSFSPAHWHTEQTQRRTTATLQHHSQEQPQDKIEFELIRLSPWGNYSFRVLARNEVGTSAPSLHTLEWCRVPADVPRRHPTGVCTLNGSPNTLTIAWEPMPPEEQNGPGFYYEIHWSRYDMKDELHTAHLSPPRHHIYQVHTVHVDDPEVGQYVVENQPSYKPYNISVLAVNHEGYAVSAYQQFIVYSSEDVPKEKVNNFMLDAEKPVTATTASFTWSHVNIDPAFLQGFFTAYKIQYWKTEEGIQTMENHKIYYDEPPPCWRKRGRQERDIRRSQHLLHTRRLVDDEVTWNSRKKRSARTFSAQLYNLRPYTNITAHIRVLNAKYEGPPSAWVTFRTKEEVPGAVSGLVVTRKDSHSLEIEWHPPSEINGVLRGYRITYSAKSSSSLAEEIYISEAASTPVPIERLSANTLYSISVAAETNMGSGPPVSIEDYTLPGGKPIPPKLSIMNVSKRSVNVTWYPASPYGFPGTHYTVQYRRVGERTWTKLAEQTHQHWAVVDGLLAGVPYEVVVVAKSGNTPRSLETYSPVQKVQLDMKRAIPQPTFTLIKTDNTRMAVELDESAYFNSVRTFKVQFRQSDSEEWEQTDNYPKDHRVYMYPLTEGGTYQVQVIVTDEEGKTTSSIEQTFSCCSNDASSGGPARRTMPSTSASIHNCSIRTLRHLYSLAATVLIVLQVLSGYS